MDNVNNRSLFRNRSGAAREKVRQMGRVQEPQGILSSFPELMRAASPQRRNLPMMQPQQPMMQRSNLPMMPQQMPMTPQPMMQPQQMPMPMMQQPAGFQDGGPVEPDTPSFMERVAQNAMLAAETFLPSQRLDSTPRQSFEPVDIAATPTPREQVVVPDIPTLVRETIGDNPEAQENFTNLENTLEILLRMTRPLKRRLPARLGSRTLQTPCARLCPKSLGATSLRPQPWTS
jgi:hypothetical protein